ncbi:unnamed protein product [Paramecium sonneborni]|uniref:Tetratricopeptide repeat protein n=1 Tax=Paramecium sonneborni TaxID=65129 RepID=A0A8S1PII0_9CILI|nr:unnamed protein product [Paramecium sonneborni]
MNYKFIFITIRNQKDFNFEQRWSCFVKKYAYKTNLMKQMEKDEILLFKSFQEINKGCNLSSNYQFKDIQKNKKFIDKKLQSKDHMKTLLEEIDQFLFKKLSREFFKPIQNTDDFIMKKNLQIFQDKNYLKYLQFCQYLFYQTIVNHQKNAKIKIFFIITTKNTCYYLIILVVMINNPVDCIDCIDLSEKNDFIKELNQLISRYNGQQKPQFQSFAQIANLQKSPPKLTIDIGIKMIYIDQNKWKEKNKKNKIKQKDYLRQQDGLNYIFYIIIDFIYKLSGNLWRERIELHEKPFEKILSFELLSNKQKMNLIKITLNKFVWNLLLNLKDAEKYCKLGDSLLKQNRLDEAKNFYQKSLHIKKTDFNAKIGIAQCLQKSHNYKEALELYKEVQNDDKNNYFISFQIAECLRNMWQDEEALAAYSQALDIHETTQGFFMQGVTLFNLNRMDEILQFYQRAKKLGIKDEWMKLFKILKFQMDENNDKAQELINQIGNDSDQQVHCRISIFKILSSLENKEENLKYANQILKIEPNNLQTLQIKFDILLEQQQYEEVILQYDQMQKINGKHESINKMKDKLYSKLSELDDYEQMDIFEQILLFNPKSITTQIMKCQFLLDKYKYKQALYTFAQILKLDWNEEILELKNQLLLKVSSEFQDDHKIFYDFYTKWLQINPSNVIVLEFMCKNYQMYFKIIFQQNKKSLKKLQNLYNQFYNSNQITL